jgi:hypothetical protein
MNIEELIKKAVVLLDKKFGLPDNGILAGGAIGNTINKLVFGTKCVINDLDIFYIDKIRQIDGVKLKKEVYTNITSLKVKHEKKVSSDYRGGDFTFINAVSENYLSIYQTSIDGKFNYIKCQSNKYSPEFLLETFDINAVCVAYDLKEKKCYWTNAFAEYLKTKELKIVNASSPSHTAVRLLKKEKELDAILNTKEEFKYLKIAMNLRTCKEIKKHFFSDLYYTKYHGVKDKLKDDFTIVTTYDKTRKLRLWRLTPKHWGYDENEEVSIFELQNERRSFTNSDDIVTLDHLDFFFRKVMKSDEMMSLWVNFSIWYKSEKYFDGIDMLKHKNRIDEFLSIIDKYRNNNFVREYVFIDMSLMKQLKVVSWVKKFFNNNHNRFEDYNRKKESEYDDLPF